MVTARNVQHLFIQAIISRGSVSENLARLLWIKCIEAVTAIDPNINIQYEDNQEGWNEFVKSINDSLNALDLELRMGQDEISGKKIYALVNAKGDEIAQMATEYAPADIQYFKAVVDLIMLAPREAFSVPSMACLREVSLMKPKSNLTKSHAESLLASFTAKGWLIRSKKGRYSLSTRSLLELQPYIKSTFDAADILECDICKEIITKGFRCPQANCQIRMHSHCYKTYRRHKSTCPSCSTEWGAESDMYIVGGGAAREGDSVRRRRDDSENDSDDEDEEMQDASQSQSATQFSQPKKSRKSKTRLDSDEEDEEVETDDNEEEELKSKSRNTRFTSRR